jgi:hypothetical protein
MPDFGPRRGPLKMLRGTVTNHVTSSLKPSSCIRRAAFLSLPARYAMHGLIRRSS